MVAAIVIFAIKKYQTQYEPSLSPVLGSCPEGKVIESDQYSELCGNDEHEDLENDVMDSCSTYCSSGVASSKYTCYGVLSSPECVGHRYTYEEIESFHPVSEGYHKHTWQCDCKALANPSPSPSSSGTPSEDGLA